MNFFQHQERARKNSKRLVGLFALAVVLISAALYVASRVIVRMTCEGEAAGDCFYPWWDAGVFAIYMVGTAAFIGLASLSKILSLRGGGGKVALMMGGQQVLPGTSDPRARRLVNVVEEMAIASGVPVPLIFVLEGEPGINAFAAGWSPQDAAVAVTRGTLDTLNRDELQGVIAHEFSHVLNGDMRLNIKMIGVLFGILAIGEIGRFVLRMTWFTGGRVRSSKKDSGGTAAIALAGLALMVIGYIGTFVGRLIQAALSRQREFLADASAVQFTRNPSGIAGALKKIGGLSEGSRLAAPAAGQVGHLLFGEGLGVPFLSSVLATHPPLTERVRRLEPRFDGLFADTTTSPEPELNEFTSGAAQAVAGFAGGGRASPERVAGAVGQVDADAVDQASEWLRAVPADVRGGLTSPEAAARLVMALSLPSLPELRQQALADMGRDLGAAEVAEIAGLRRAADAADPRVRLILVDLATPLLRGLSRAAAARLVERVEALAAMDGTIDVFEFALHWLVVRRVARRGKATARTRGGGLRAVRGPVATLLSALAQAGSPDPHAQARAWSLGARRVGADPSAPLVPWSPRALGEALDRLAEAPFSVKESVLDGAAHVVLADAVVTAEEADLLRLVGLALDCPLPALLRRHVRPEGPSEGRDLELAEHP